MDNIEKTNIENKIYEIRGVQVMLDSDLAKLYECINGTKSINLAVKRNIEKFPNDIYFQISENELFDLRFQIETTNSKSRTLPYAFTEEGVAMLATVLHTKVASQMSLKIIRAFVAMRKYISSNLIEQQYYKNMVLDDHNRIKLLEKSFDKLNKKQKVNTIFFKGQIFDAYVVLMNICEKAKKKIIIIDNYAGKELFNLLKDINKNITVITSNINEEDYDKYKMQYNNINIEYSDEFHDRFIIVDRKILYHCGSSFKDLGKKCFAINLIDDKKYLNDLLDKLKN